MSLLLVKAVWNLLKEIWKYWITVFTTLGCTPNTVLEQRELEGIERNRDSWQEFRRKKGNTINQWNLTEFCGNFITVYWKQGIIKIFVVCQHLIVISALYFERRFVFFKYWNVQEYCETNLIISHIVISILVDWYRHYRG